MWRMSQYQRIRGHYLKDTGWLQRNVRVVAISAFRPEDSVLRAADRILGR